jgi:hypothetical protein
VLVASDVGGALVGELCVTSGLAPASASDFRSLAGAAGAASVVVNVSSGGASHDHNLVFAQLGSTRDLWIFGGNQVAEAAPTAPLTLLRVRLTASGSTWTAGAVAFGSTPAAWLLGAAGTASHAWAMYGDYAAGTVRFARADATGGWEEPVAAIPSPVSDGRTSQTMFGVFSISPDETRIWAIYTRDPGPGGTWWDFTPSGAAWDGSAWQVRTDVANGDSQAQPFAEGLAGSVGFDTGVVGLMTRTTGQSFNGPIRLATMRASPGVVYTAGSAGGSLDAVTATDQAGATATAPVTVP